MAVRSEVSVAAGHSIDEADAECGAGLGWPGPLTEQPVLSSGQQSSQPPHNTGLHATNTKHGNSHHLVTDLQRTTTRDYVNQNSGLKRSQNFKYQSSSSQDRNVQPR